jgi:hypothetical protein
LPRIAATKDFPPKTDFFSKHGAHMLADCIMAYWAKRGFPKVTAEPYALRGLGAWGVCSNLVNGLPPVKRPKAAGLLVPPTLTERKREFLR